MGLRLEIRDCESWLGTAGLALAGLVDVVLVHRIMHRLQALLNLGYYKGPRERCLRGGSLDGLYGSCMCDIDVLYGSYMCGIAGLYDSYMHGIVW